MKAVMYHYIRRENKDQPYFRYLHADDFARQLDWFQKNDRLISLEEFTEVLDKKRPLPTNGVVLTFDDGFSDHYENVLPELKSRNTFGIFYVPTFPHTRKPELLDVHKIHQLTGAVQSETLMTQLQALVNDDMLPDQHRKEFREKTYAKHNDGDATKQFKRTLNYFVDYKVRGGILDRLLVQNQLNPDATNFYLTPLQIREMQENGMIIGSHSVTHPVFSKITPDEQKREIDESFTFITQAVGGDLTLKTFCYPYGGFHSFTLETEEILTRQGVRFTFNVESRDISEADLFQRPQALPRYDCNEFPYGKAR